MGNRRLSIPRSPAVSKRKAKLFHRKSRTGCKRCRARRVKCDEDKPVCGNCVRLDLGCVYDRVNEGGDRSSRPSTLRSATIFSEPASIEDPPESEARRKLELQLFYQYMTDSGPSLGIDDTSRGFWVTALCRTAFRSEAVLYSIYLIASLHTLKRSNYSDTVAQETCAMYLNMCLREHHRDIAHMTLDNVDFICLASSMVRVYGFVELQDRSREPYKPPVEWLRRTGTSVVVFRNAWNLARNQPQSIAVKIINTVAHCLYDGEKTKYGEGFTHLMEGPEDPFHWDAEVEAAYSTTTNLLGSIWTSMADSDSSEGRSSTGRRLIAFPMLVPIRFVDMVEEQRPRALVMLAHYFALLKALSGFWWVGEAGPREVRAIADVLPVEWRPLMSWPLQIMEKPVFISG